MKKYLLVAYDTYYPERGLNNIKATSDDINTLQGLVGHVDFDWQYEHFAIFDRDTLQVVWSNDGDADSIDHILNYPN